MRRIFTTSSLIDHGISLVSQRPHTKFELFNKLKKLCYKQKSRSKIRISKFEKKKGFNLNSTELQNTRTKAEQTFIDCSEAVPNSIQELEERGHVDDYKYALWHIDQRARWKPKSRKELQKELLEKRVDLSDINSALEISVKYCEEEACRNVVEKKTHLPPSKLTTYLLRRGFPREMTMKWVAMRKE